MLVVNDMLYRKTNQYKSTTHWICTFKRGKTKCKVTSKVINDEVTVNGNHNHDIMTSLISQRDFENEICEATRQQTNVKLKRIYKQVATTIPDTLKKNHLSSTYSKRKHSVRQIVKYCYLSLLLPHGLIREAMELIVNECHQLQVSPIIKESLQNFLKYILSTLTGTTTKCAKFAHSIWTHYGVFRNRTRTLGCDILRIVSKTTLPIEIGTNGRGVAVVVSQ